MQMSLTCMCICVVESSPTTNETHSGALLPAATSLALPPLQRMKSAMSTLMRGWQNTITRARPRHKAQQQILKHSAGPHKSAPSTNGFLSTTETVRK